MRNSRKQQKATEALMAMIAAHKGTDVAEIKKEVPAPVEESPFTTEPMQKELCLEFIHQPTRYMSKKCKYCNEFFGTSYRSVGYCSDLCRSREFEETMGVPFNFVHKSQVELWGGEPPRIIKPTLWRNLASLLQILKPVIEGSEPPSEVSSSEPELESELESEPLPDLPHTSPTSQIPERPFSEPGLFDEELAAFEF